MLSVRCVYASSSDSLILPADQRSDVAGSSCSLRQLMQQLQSYL